MMKFNSILIPVFYLIIAGIICPDYIYPVTIFFTAATFWFFEIIPLHITALLIPIAGVLTKTISFNKAISSFCSDVLILLFGVTILAYSLRKHQCEIKIIDLIIESKLVGTSFKKLLYIIGIGSFLVSMWISNVATTLMFLTISLGLLSKLEYKFESNKERNNTYVYVMLLCTYSASVGGLATPIGSPPNLLVMDFLEKNNLAISFIDWIKFGIPLSALLLFIVFVILRLFIKLPELKFNPEDLIEQKKFKTPQKQALVIFVLAIIMWVLSEILFKNNFNSTYILISFVIILFLIPYKENNIIKRNLDLLDFYKFEWKTILLFGGGICLGNIITESKLVDLFVPFIINYKFSVGILFAICTFTAVFISEFVSNTATVAVLNAIIYSLANHLGYNTTGFLLAMAFAASLGFMLPTSTVPNALVFSTGKINMRIMMKVGFVFDLVALIIVTTFLGWYFNIF